MITKITKDCSNFISSFHGDVIVASVKELINAIGLAPIRWRNVADKVQNEWELQSGNVIFTLYDWKEYREYDDDEPIKFHIGAEDKAASLLAYAAVVRALNKASLLAPTKR